MDQKFIKSQFIQPEENLYWTTEFISFNQYLINSQIEYFEWDEKFTSIIFTFNTDYIYKP